MAAELLIRQFEKLIVPELFPDNSFMSRSINDDEYVKGNSVDIQNSGTIPDVLVDNASFPLTVSQRTDTAHQYLLENLNTEVTQITTREQLIEIGGTNKMNSISSQQARAINTKAADRCLVNWLSGLAAGQKVETTGALRATLAPGATGQRKAITEDDILSSLEQLYVDDVMPEGENAVMVVDPKFRTDLMKIDAFTRYDAIGTGMKINDGRFGSIYNVDVYLRSRVAYVDASFNVKAEGAAGAATDASTAILYHPDYVRKAVGAFKVYLNPDRAEYSGSLLATELRFGSVRARNDGKGVVQIYEGT